MSKGIIYYIPAALWAVAILLLSTVFGATVPNPIPELISPDKLAHAAAYFVLAAALFVGLFYNSILVSRTAWIVVLACAAYGILMEVLQYALFPNRFFEWWDMVANLAGALLARLIVIFFIK